MIDRTLLVFSLLIAAAGCATSPNPNRPGALLEGATLPKVDPGSLREGDQPPKLIQIRNPEYPARLRKQGVSGTVVVEYIIGADGRVVSATAVESPAPDLSALAVQAVLESTYEPALQNGKPTAVKMRVPITFDLPSRNR